MCHIKKFKKLNKTRKYRKNRKYPIFSNKNIAMISIGDTYQANPADMCLKVYCCPLLLFLIYWIFAQPDSTAATRQKTLHLIVIIFAFLN